MQQRIFFISAVFIATVFFLFLSGKVFSAPINKEPYNTGWRINTDNDLFTGRATDRDYTGGLALTLSGQRVQQYPLSIDHWRKNIDHLLSINRFFQPDQYLAFHSQQYGITLFTPDDITTTAPIHDDRPYASLIYLSNTALTVLPDKNSALTSNLTLGFLGLSLAPDIQQIIHDVTGSNTPKGWRNQISSGGEPTFLLSYALQNNFIDHRRQQFKTQLEVNVGYLTDINAGFSWRWGKIHSPWWTFNPYQSKYMQSASPVFAGSNDNEFFLWAGARLNVRLYNALLQGQFRHSVVTVSASNIENLVAEYWFGLSYHFLKKYQTSVFWRGNSPEFKGPNQRSMAWVGLVFSRAY